jgi:hypothetical protein
MPPTLPFWFKQRQCRAEPVDGERMLKVSGPNLGEAFLSVEQDKGGHWVAALRFAPEGEEAARTEAEIDSVQDAWRAAFELYRTHVIV